MPLLSNSKEGEEEEPYEFEEGQEAVSKLLHLVYHKSNNDIYFENLSKFKKVISKGGNKRQKYTVPPLIFSLLKLSNEIVVRAQNPPEVDTTGEQDITSPLIKIDHARIFKEVQGLIESIQEQYPEQALRLYL
jgi:hypothetical protein